MYQITVLEVDFLIQLNNIHILQYYVVARVKPRSQLAEIVSDCLR